MKVFASLFPKSDLGQGRIALVARRRERNFLFISFAFKKRRRGELAAAQRMTRGEPSPGVLLLFFLYVCFFLLLSCSVLVFFRLYNIFILLSHFSFSEKRKTLAKRKSSREGAKPPSLHSPPNVIKGQPESDGIYVTYSDVSSL